MINIIIFFLCSLSGFLIGKFFEKRISEKGEFYRDLQKYVISFEENVEGRMVELSKFNDGFCDGSSESFVLYLKDKKTKIYFSKIQKKNLSAFFDNLSCISSQELLNHLNYFKRVFEEDGKRVNEEVSRANLYSKLGLLLGAMVGILLI